MSSPAAPAADHLPKQALRQVAFGEQVLQIAEVVGRV
jgi:hypothetical protein